MLRPGAKEHSGKGSGMWPEGKWTALALHRGGAVAAASEGLAPNDTAGWELPLEEEQSGKKEADTAFTWQQSRMDCEEVTVPGWTPQAALPGL